MGNIPNERHANRYVEAANTAEILGPMGPESMNERQARELVPLAKQVPDAAREVYEPAKTERGVTFHGGMTTSLHTAIL